MFRNHYVRRGNRNCFTVFPNSTCFRLQRAKFCCCHFAYHLMFVILTMEIRSIEEVKNLLKSDRFDFTNRQVLASKKPLDCGTEECILGVDEAGRGPVLGPMVYGVSYVPKKRIPDFEDIGCADSKTLTESKREDLFSIICACEEYFGWAVDIISPNYISNKMLKRTKHSLNEIAEEATVQLIQSVLDKGVNVAEIYVDTIGPPEKYQEKLSKIFSERKVTVAKKADSLYPIVSAASICAKVIRDTTIKNWKFSESVSIELDKLGSGYPNDPQTKAFLKDNVDEVFGFPSLVRFSWSTASKILDDASIVTPVEWEDEDDLYMNRGESITSFFKPKSETTMTDMKHSFFKQNNLASVCYF